MAGPKGSGMKGDGRQGVGSMSNRVKFALLTCASALALVWALVYFSPYQTCQRALKHGDPNAAYLCRGGH